MEKILYEHRLIACKEIWQAIDNIEQARHTAVVDFNMTLVQQNIDKIMRVLRASV